MTISLIKARRSTGKLSFLGSPVGFLSTCSRAASSLGLPGTTMALATTALGGSFLGSSLQHWVIQQSVQDTFFFLPQILCIL